ncbi:hypothetical protein [Nocardioides baculatus]|uniref:DUF4240 domain-containing protein n=1 Tax=Nocardioides baculatus TaxID=2801337 RepID=A0ABS1LEI3_9ACTN|nr:hypothetical protein [Nocardioides baculatus]MBL0749788.1 hypothetical protein [Nocardioides baculatus]
MDAATIVVTAAVTLVATLIAQALREFTRGHVESQAAAKAEERAKAREGRDEVRQMSRENREEARQVEREQREDEWKREQERREEQRAHLAEARRREELASEEIDKAVSRAVQLVPAVARSRFADDRKERQASAELRGLFEEISAQAAYLPADLRVRIVGLADLLGAADEMEAGVQYGTPYHYHSVYTIARRCGEEAHELLAAFLRHDSLPHPSKTIAEYALAYEDLVRDKESEFAMEIAEEAGSRTDWLRARPGFAKSLGELEPEPKADQE